MVEKPNIDAGFSRMLPEDLTGAVGPETGKEQGNREILSRIVRPEPSQRLNGMTLPR